MIKSATERGLIDEEEVVMEQLISFKRAGADAILSYFAIEIAKIIRSRNQSF